MPTPPEKSREELYHDLFITLLMPHIDQPINDYYSKLLTERRLFIHIRSMLSVLKGYMGIVPSDF